MHFKQYCLGCLAHASYLIADEESRIAANSTISSLSEKMATLTDQMRTEQTLMMKLAENQLELRPILARLSQSMEKTGLGLEDDAVRTNIRNIDIHIARLLEELATGRTEMISELRSEIRVLSRTMAAIAEKTAR